MGYELGLVSFHQYQSLLHKKSSMETTIELLNHLKKEIGGRQLSLAQYLRRPEVSYAHLIEQFQDLVPVFDADIHLQIELAVKYEGYIDRQKKEIAKLENLDSVKIPLGFDFRDIKGLRREAIDTLNRIQPYNLGQASRMIGVTPADISCVMIHLKNKAACCTIL